MLNDVGDPVSTWSKHHKHFTLPVTPIATTIIVSIYLSLAHMPYKQHIAVDGRGNPGPASAGNYQ